jgi:hypothetical protein
VLWLLDWLAGVIPVIFAGLHCCDVTDRKVIASRWLG